MNDDDRRDPPPLRAGRDGGKHDPDAAVFGEKATVPEPAAPTPHETAEPLEAPAERRAEFVGTGMFWGLLVGIVLAIAVIGFSAQNTQSVTVKVIVWEWSSPLFVVILVSVIVGIVLAEAVGLVYRARRRRRLADRAELQRLRGKP
jgi:uncharacterized integral membrane protein